MRHFFDPAGPAFEAIVLDQNRNWTLTSESRRKRVSTLPAPEAAASDKQVMIAAVYNGRQVRLYRNGKLNGTFQGTASTPREILSVTLGKVSSRGDDATPNHFVGSIEDARIYDRALSPRVILSLRPGKVETRPRPMAAWSFEDATAADVIGSYSMAEINNGARIEDGKLILDGVDDHLYQAGRPNTPGMACIAHVTSGNLMEWEYHRPVFASKAFCYTECPDYFQMGDWHYFLFSSVRSRKDTSGRKNASGTYYIMSRKRDGPYHLPGDPLLFGSGRGRMDSYVGRTIEFGGQRLLYYHTVHGDIRDCIRKPVTWGAPKRVVQHADGHLSLKYWPQLDQIECGIRYRTPSPVDLQQTIGQGQWTQQSTEISGVSVENNTTILWLPVNSTDLMITGTISPSNEAIAGLLWRFEKGTGRALLVDLKQQTAMMTAIEFDLEENRITTQRIDDYFGLAATGELHVRIMLRSHRADVYIDDRWIFSTSMIDAPRAGRVGLLIGRGGVTFRDLQIAGLKPLETPVRP